MQNIFYFFDCVLRLSDDVGSAAHVREHRIDPAAPTSRAEHCEVNGRADVPARARLPRPALSFHEVADGERQPLTRGAARSRDCPPRAR